MRFMILIKADEDTEAGVLPSQQLLTERALSLSADRDAQYEIEIRPVFGAEDFGDVMTPELREQEERLRARATELNLAATRS